MNINQIKKNKLKTLLQFSIPSIVAMLLQTVITITDGYFTGNYVGDSALAAINLGLPILYVYLGTGLCVGVGGSVNAIYTDTWTVKSRGAIICIFYRLLPDYADYISVYGVGNNTGNVYPCGWQATDMYAGKHYGMYIECNHGLHFCGSNRTWC